MRDCILKALRSSAARTCIVRRYGMFTCTSTGINDNHFHAKFNQPSHMPVKLQFSSSTTGASQKYKELSQDTEEFLGRVDGFDSKRKTHEITRLIQQWSTFWSSSDQKNDSMRHFNSKEENDDVLLKGARIVDQLANILLDVRESSIRNSTDGDDDDQNRDRTPYLTTLNLALAFWGKCPPSNTVNGEKAEHLLNRMEQLGILSFNDVGKDKVQFKKVMAAYGAAIQAWVVSPDSAGRTGPNNGNINGALKAQSLLEKLESISIEHNIQPQLRIYNSCMHGFAIRGMVDEAEQLLQKLEDRSRSNAELTPDVLTFSSCINAYLKSTKLGNHTNRSATGRRSGGDSVAQRAEALLDRMVKRYETTGEDQFRPNQTTFGTVISLFAKSHTKTGAEDADRILQWLISLYDKDVNTINDRDERNESYSLQPSYVHFISVLLGYQRKKFGRAAAVRRIEELLVQMDTMYEAGNDKVKPTYQCFVIYLNALAKSGEAEKAEQVLHRIENLLAEEKSFEINNYGYNLVMDAWAKSRKPGRGGKAKAVLNRMNDLAIQTGNKSLLPDKLSYTCLLNAIINDKESGFMEKCENIIQTMEETGGRIKPDVFAYNYLIKIYSNANMPDKAEGVISRIEKAGLEPSLVCYNNLMSAYAKSDRSGSAEDVIRIFKRMETVSYLTPDIKSYTMCLDALGRSKSASGEHEAEELVNRFIQSARKTGFFRASVPIFHSLQLVYIRGNSVDKAKKTLGVIKLMEENGIEPDMRAYNSVIRACSLLPPDADKGARQLAVDMAARVLHVLQSSKKLRPEPTTYNDLISVCNLINEPAEKRQTIDALFKKCCDDGLLNRNIVATLKRVAGNQFWILVGRDRGHVDVTSLDPSWSRNVRISAKKY